MINTIRFLFESVINLMSSTVIDFDTFQISLFEIAVGFCIASIVIYLVFRIFD